MNKRLKPNSHNRLKSRINRSHNSDDQQDYDRLKALVKFLARKAAEDDYRILLERINNQTHEGDEP